MNTNRLNYLETLLDDTRISTYVYWDNEPITILNKNLMLLKSVSYEQLTLLHVERLGLEEDLKATNNQSEISELYRLWTHNQFFLQTAWGFPLDENYHPSHRLPHCICPKLDGDDAIGTPYKVRVVGCQIHDGEKNESNLQVQ